MHLSLKKQEIFVLLQGQDALFRQLSPGFSLSWRSADVTSKSNHENSISKYPLGFSPITVPIFTETSWASAVQGLNDVSSITRELSGCQRWLAASSAWRIMVAFRSLGQSAHTHAHTCTLTHPGLLVRLCVCYKWSCNTSILVVVNVQNLIFHLHFAVKGKQLWRLGDIDLLIFFFLNKSEVFCEDLRKFCTVQRLKAVLTSQFSVYLCKNGALTGCCLKLEGVWKRRADQRLQPSTYMYVCFAHVYPNTSRPSTGVDVYFRNICFRPSCVNVSFAKAAT